MGALPYLRLMRPLQWPKNAFVIAPLFFSLRLSHTPSLVNGLLATIAFVLVSSAVYVFNDLRDVEADRAHGTKRFRPLASGAVPASGAIVLLIGLGVAIVALYVAAGFSHAFGLGLLLYVAINIAYSLGLKQVPLVEAFMVASGFVIRLVVGSMAITVELTPWIVITTALVALLLVLGKRRSDSGQQRAVHKHHKALATYSPGALDMMLSVAAGGTVMTYVLFCVSEYALRQFDAPYLYVTSVFVVLGVMRYIQLAHDGGGTDDPSALVVKDPLMRYTILGWVVVVYLLIY